MSTIQPDVALELLHQQGHITYHEMESLKGERPAILRQAMEEVERSVAFQESLSGLVEEIRTESAEQARIEAGLRGDPRYAQAPDVEGEFVRQFWDAGDYLNEVSRTAFTVPLPYLVENRERLSEIRDYGDSDWLAFDLGLTTDHEGPFDVDGIEESVSAWLKATETAG